LISLEEILWFVFVTTVEAATLLRFYFLSTRRNNENVSDVFKTNYDEDLEIELMFFLLRCQEVLIV